MTYPIRNAILTIAMVGALAMAPVAPEAGNVMFLVAGVFAILLVRRQAADLLLRPVVWMPMFGLVLVATSYGLGAGSFEGLVGVLYFAPLLTVWPLLALVHPLERAPDPASFAVLSLCGVGGAAIVAIGEVVTTGTFRAGATVANPIHFADVALAAGFLATIGLAYCKGPWRYLFLLGPALAAATVVLSGTRGAVVAFVAMIIAAVTTAAALRLVSLKSLVVGSAALGIVIVIAGLAGVAETSGIERVMHDVSEVVRTGLPTDNSTERRLQMYLGGVRAFLQSPFVGHGPAEFTAIASALADKPFEGAPHLHNDLIDFAASGGVLAIVAYFLFLLAPLVEVMRAPPTQTRNGLIVVVTTLTVGYFVMGLTNAMFGILTVTVFFVASCVISGLLARPTVENSGGQ